MPLTWPAVILWVGIAALLWAAAHDMIARTIPNLAPALVAGSGLTLRIADDTVGIAILAALLVLTGAALCWRAGWLGGGDAKLLPAMALLLPPAQLVAALIDMAASGAVLALPYIAARGRIPSLPPGRRSVMMPVRAWRAELFRLRRGGPLPYAVAICVGALLSLWTAVG